jgi:hypothetical protein
MRVEQIVARPAQYCGPNDTLARAAQLMWRQDCGCLPKVRTASDRLAEAMMRAGPIRRLPAVDAKLAV